MTTTPRRCLVTAAQIGHTTLNFASPLTAATDARTLSGLVAPYGIPGRTSAGLLTITPDAIRLPSDLSRVKLVDNHQTPPVAVGYATAASSTDRGLEMTFTVAQTDAGDNALLEASQRTRDAFSVELVDVVTDDNDTVTSAELSAVAQVAIPAYADARITPPAQLAASQTVPAPTAPDSSGPARTTAPAAAPAMLTGQATVQALNGQRPLTDMYAALERVMTGQSRPHFEAALSDIINTNVYDTIGQGSYAGQLWDGNAYVRRFVPLLRSGVLTSWKVKGWKWDTRPAVADYAGDKADIPSGAVSVIPAETEAHRLAGGHDLDRKFKDFRDSEFLAAYFAAMTESYAKQSDAKALAFILASASDGGATAAGGSVLAAAALAVDTLEDQTDGASVDYVLVNRADRRALLEVAAQDKPAFLKLLGVEPDRFLATNQIPSGTVVAGTRAAGTFYELPGSPIRVEALDIARGGVDEALFGYYATLLHDSIGIVKATITPAA